MRWRQTLTSLSDAGFTTYVELGPGEVLGRLAKRTLKGARPLSVAVPDDLDSLLEALAASPVRSATPLEGEHLFATERLVVSPGAASSMPATRSASVRWSASVISSAASETTRSAAPSPEN